MVFVELGEDQGVIRRNDDTSTDQKLQSFKYEHSVFIFTRMKQLAFCEIVFFSVSLT